MQEDSAPKGGTATRRSWRSSPALWAGLSTLAVLLAAGLWPLWHALNLTPGGAQAAEGLPWQVTLDGAGRSRVFGLALGAADLAAVEALWGQDLVVALIAETAKPPALEAYVESFQAGFVTGKLVLTLAADAGWMDAAWARSPRGDLGAAASPEAGAVRRRELAPEDRSAARSLRVQALSFLPTAHLDEATILQRFGVAGERWTAADGSLQLLYPKLGVAVALPPAAGTLSRAHAVVQYVAPIDFERLLAEPLRAAKTVAPS